MSHRVGGLLSPSVWSESGPSPEAIRGWKDAALGKTWTPFLPGLSEELLPDRRALVQSSAAFSESFLGAGVGGGG